MCKAPQPGVHLQKCHVGVECVVKDRRSGAILADITQQHPVPQHTQIGVVDAGKGLKALSPGLSGPGAQDDPTVENNGDSRHVLRRAAECVRKVDLGVRAVKADRLLGAGKHDGLGALLNEIAECRRRIGHGICPVGENKAVVLPVMLSDTAGHQQPVPRGDVGAVQVQKLYAFHHADARNGGDVCQKVAGSQLRRQPALRHL